MTRTPLIAITLVFVLAGLVASLVGGAHARNTEATPHIAQTTSIERCALQPHRVSHPDSGAPILVLHKEC